MQFGQRGELEDTSSLTRDGIKLYIYSIALATLVKQNGICGFSFHEVGFGFRPTFAACVAQTKPRAPTLCLATQTLQDIVTTQTAAPKI